MRGEGTSGAHLAQNRMGMPKLSKRVSRFLLDEYDPQSCGSG